MRGFPGSTRWRLPHPALVAALATFSLVPLEAPAAETVELRFGWPDGLQAEVAFEGTRARARGDVSERQVVAGSYAMSTRREPDGLLVEIGDMSIDLDGHDESSRDSVQALLGRFAAAIPDHVVGQDGKIVRVVGVESLRTELRGMVALALETQQEAVRARIERALDATLTAEQLESSVRSSWNRDVGNWAGLSLESERVYEGMATAGVPLLPGKGVPTKVSYRLVGRRPCTPGQSPARCVALELDTSIGGEDTVAIIEALARNLSARTGRQTRIEELTVKSGVRVLTEPDTLLPHEVEFSRSTVISFTVEGAQPQTHSQEERRMTRYTYRVAGP